MADKITLQSDIIREDIETLRRRLASRSSLSPEDVSSDWVKFADPERAIEELEIALDLALKAERRSPR